MAYAVPNDVLAAYGEDVAVRLTRRDAGDTEDTVDTAALTAALADASDEIDSYLSARYELPLKDGQGASLKRVAIDIAVYRLSVDSALLTDDRRSRYEDAMRYLVRLSKGEIRIGADEPPGGPKDRAGPEVEARTRRWGRRRIW